MTQSSFTNSDAGVVRAQVPFGDISQLLFDYLNTKKINQLFASLQGLRGTAFIDAFLQSLNIRFSTNEEDFKKIPLQGAFMMVANHPFGLLDGLIVLRIMKAVRPDFKMMDDGWLRKISALQDEVIAMSPIEKELPINFSFGGAQKVFDLLENGCAAGCFPCDDISGIQGVTAAIEDGEWNKRYMKIISAAEVPVLPVYIEGNNSMMFHFMGMLFSGLKNARLPSEILGKKDHNIRVRIGMPVPVKQLRQFRSAHDLSRFLRAKTYALGNQVSVKKIFFAPFRKKKQGNQAKEIASPVETLLLQQDIARLRQEGCLIIAQQEFEVYIADIGQIPHLINEIGRLREITFRAVGEGTGLSLDLDEYDLYYKHLILWDAKLNQVAGGYRMGPGDYIISRYGMKGFYTRSLFKMKKELLPVLMQSVELGRSYVVKAYQQKRLPLFLLWRGILAFLLKNPNYRYLFGPVSISNKYTEVCKLLIIAYIKKHHFDHQLAQYIAPKKKYKPKLKHVDVDILVDSAAHDIRLIDKYIQDFDPEMTGVPVLLKKYLNQNARIVGFNIDPHFADALDGLMFLDLKDVPVDMIEGLK